MSGVGLRRVTLVLEGGDIGAKFALALAVAEGLAAVSYVHRRDGTVQVYAMTTANDGGARDRWAKRCRLEGLTVARAPWETKKERTA